MADCAGSPLFNTAAKEYNCLIRRCGMQKRMFSNAQLRRLIIPLLIEQLLVMLVGMLDTIMVSSAGEAAISGVSIVNDVNNLMINLLAALAGGGAVVVSQYLGSGDQENTTLSASQLLTVTFVISLLLGTVCVVFHRGILGLLYSQVEADVMESACVYFWITALSFPFLGIYNSSAALFRSMNETRATMKVSMLMNMINLIGNYILVYRMHMGAAGVAIPTLISRIAAAGIMGYMAFGKDLKISVAWNRILQWRRDIVARILTIAVPNSIENGLFQMGKIIVSAIVATYGTKQIAANGVTNSLVVLAYTTEMAMQLAVITVVGQAVGANDYEQAKYYIRKMVLMAWVMAAANNLILYLLSPYALNMYTLTPETMAIARQILAMECAAVALLHAPAFVLPTALRASGDARYTMYVGVCSMFAARVAGAYILGTVMGLGVVGTRIAMYLDWCVRIAFFVIRYRSGKWMNYRVAGS